MRNYIILNGQNSNDISGLLIQSLPPITKPLVRTEVEEIDGRNGDIVTSLGYSSYNKEITIGLYGDFDINAIISYFNSDGTVIFSNEPDKFYYYQIFEQIDFEKLIRFKTATVKLHCQPFKYSAFEGDYILDPPAPNLLTIPDYTNTTNGVTITASGGTVTIQGKPTTATEFYLPITPLALAIGSYDLSATSNGINPNYCSVRLIGSAPANADSLGGNYITLAEGTVTLKGALAAAKTFNYLWFYINAGQNLDFTVTFEVENQAQKMISGEGSSLALINTAEAPFSKFELEGDTFQQTYSGKNLLNISSGTTSGGITSTWNNNVVTLSGKTTATYANISGTDQMNFKDGKTYTLSILSPTNLFRVQIRVNYDGTNHGYTIDKNGTSVTFSIPSGAASPKLRIMYIDGFSANLDINGTFSFQIEEGSTATSYEPYVGGTASPNPDYPQDIQVVRHQDMIRITSKNLANADELYLTPDIERTSDGLRKEITSNTLVTYHSGSITNPPGIYTISFEARISNPDEAVLVLDDNASIWGIDDLTLKNAKGEVADQFDRTLSLEWQRYSFTVIAYTSQPWTVDRAMTLYFSTYTNSPVFELRNLQIEAGTTATEFENSDTQMYPINFRTGKNMLSEDFLSVGDMIYGVPDPTVKYRVHNSFGPLKVKPNTKYTISANLGNTVQGMRVEVTECDNNTLYLSDSGWQQLASGAYTFTTGEETEFVKLLLSLSTTSSEVTTGSTEDTTEFDNASAWLRGTTIQVEAGDTATAYEPYESMELCKIGDYQDSIYKSGDDWYVHKETGNILVNGTQNMNFHNTRNNIDGYRLYFTSNIKSQTQVYSERFIYQDWDNYQITSSTRKYSVVSTAQSELNNVYVTFKDNTITTASDFQTWFSNNNTLFYYVLATPTDTKITNEETLEQLNMLINQAHAYRGTTYLSSLTGTTSNLPPIFAVEVAKSSDGTITNSGNFPAKPKLTIHGSGNIGVNLNGNQIFQIALGDEGYITIDTELMEAYQDSTENLKNRLVVGDYDNFSLNPGDNSITFSGTVTKCIVENYSRWL